MNHDGYWTTQAEIEEEIARNTPEGSVKAVEFQETHCPPSFVVTVRLTLRARFARFVHRIAAKVAFKLKPWVRLDDDLCRRCEEGRPAAVQGRVVIR